MQVDYKTIATNGAAEEVIRKSLFICHLKRTHTEEEAAEFIAAIKKEHAKATHNCAAYVIGENDEHQRANDDGEPSGTAGIPMLEVLKKNELKNVTAVVTRYFGGIKLGAGGLIRAYSGSVANALSEIGIVERKRMKEIDLTVSYPLSGKVEKELQETGVPVQETIYTDTVTYRCLVEPNGEASFEKQFIDSTNGTAIFEEREILYIEMPI